MANSAIEMIFTPRWYTVAQVAQLLNDGESKVGMLIITGQLRSIKDGRFRLRVAYAQAWLNRLATQCQCCAQGIDAPRTFGSGSWASEG